MKTIFQLAWSFFKEGRNKYFVSIGGFVSVLCLSSLLLYVQSHDSFQKKQMLYIGSDYEFFYNDKKDLEKFYEFLPEDKRGESVEIMSYGSADINNKSARVIALTQTVEKSPVPLMRGDCPRNEDEILITNKYADETGLSVGDTISLRITKDVSNEVLNKVYHISGVYYYINTFDIYGKFEDEMILLYPEESDSQILRGYQSLKNMAKKDLSELNEKAKGLFGSLRIIPNETAIDILYGNYESMALKSNIKYFMIVMLMILQILMNMFFVSLNEKKEYIGMMKSLGLSKWQLILYSFFETTIYSFLIVTTGILVSFLLMHLVLPYFASLEPEYTTPFPYPLIVNMQTIVFVFILNFSLLFVCNLLAYTSFRKYTIIQLLKGNSSTKIKNKYTKNKFLKKKNIEQAIANRNYKRNLISTISVFISVCSCVAFLIIGNFLFKTTNDMELASFENVVTVGNHKEILVLGISIFIMIIALVNQFITISASILAKKKDYSILKSIGLTNKQLLHLLFFEYGLVVIKGFIIGVVLSLYYINDYYTKNLAQFYDWMFDWSLIVKMGFVFMLFSVLSVYCAYYLLSKDNIIETIRE